ncbi:MAG: lamin tail domain-containing protein, partial [Oscillospiraceae bacterium]|nr:lamin tail domain-containing protein [Oscillospiraceae bacterium]
MYGGGYAIMNTRPIAMENLEYVNATVRDPRESGRAVTGNPSSRITTSYFHDDSAPIPLLAKPYAGFKAVWTGATPEPNNPNLVLIKSAGSHNVTLTFEKVDDILWEQNRAFEIKSLKSTHTERGWNVNALGDRTSRPPTNDKGYVEIRNNTDHALSTRGMFISDQAGSNVQANRFKFTMPSIIIKPGQSAFFPTRHNGNTSAFVAGDPHNYTTNTPNYFKKRSKMDFNIDSDDRLYLFDAAGTQQQMVEVTVTHADQAQLRDADGSFRIHNFTSAGVPVDWATRVSKWIGRIAPAARPAAMPCVGGCGRKHP